jgi:hypothetical protein
MDSLAIVSFYESQPRGCIEEGSLVWATLIETYERYVFISRMQRDHKKLRCRIK